MGTQKKKVINEHGQTRARPVCTVKRYINAYHIRIIYSVTGLRGARAHPLVPDPATPREGT